MLLGRLRGRLGEALARRLSPADHARLFPDSGHAASPILPRLESLNRRPVLCLRLIGRAALWAQPVADSLADLGPTPLLVPGAPAPLIAAGPVWLHSGSMADLLVPLPPVPFDLVLVTPLCLADDAPPGGPLLARSLRRRRTALADWLPETAEMTAVGVGMGPDAATAADPAPLAPDCGHTPDLTLTAAVHPVSWTRIAHRQQGREVPMRGWLGRLTIARMAADLAPALRLAEAVHLGRHGAFGLGRVAIAATPPL